MLRQNVKSIAKKFTVCLVLFSLVQASQAGIDAKYDNVDMKKLSLSQIDMKIQEAALDEQDVVPQVELKDQIIKEEAQAVSLNNNASITDSDKKINLSLRDSDVKQVLRMFAQKAAMNVIFHTSVNGVVTLDLVDVTLNDAFMLVLRSAQLTYMLDGNNIIVTANTAEGSLSFSKQNLTVLPVKYERAQNIADFLNANIFGANITGLANNKIASYNPTSNEVMIFGSENDVVVAKKIIEKLDKKPLITTFKVNHTTPREMAMLICNTFVETNKDASTEDMDENEDDDDLSSDSSSSSSSSGSSSSSSSSSDDDEEITKVKLGSGVIACRATQNSISGDSQQQNSPTSQTTAGDVVAFNSAPLSVIYFAELGTININGGSADQVKLIGDFVQDNDKKQPMAYVELSVIELNDSGSKDFSNSWSLWTPFLSLTFDSSEGLNTAPGNPIFFFGDNVGGGAQYSGQSALSYTLKYLVQNGKGRVLSSPKIMVTNGQKSTIDLTSDYVKSVTTELLNSTSTGTTAIGAVSRTYEIGDDEGLKIELVPFISPDGYVSMNIKPELATVKESIFAPGVTGANELQATLLQRRDLFLNNVRIKDGETLVIAGLIKESEEQTVTKIPVLGDLPFVGVFFRSTKNEKSKEELVIMVTPHIIYSAEDIAKIQSVDL